MLKQKLYVIGAVILLIFAQHGLRVVNVFAQNNYEEVESNDPRSIVRQELNVIQTLAEQADDYAKTNYLDALKILKEDEQVDYYEDKTDLLRPFVVCDIEHINQYEQFYYPIEFNEEIIAVAQVIKVDSEWSMAVQTYMNKFLNEIDYVHDNNWLFLSSGQFLEAFNEKKIKMYYGNESQVISQLSVEDKVNIIDNKLKNICRNKIIRENKSYEFSYLPSYKYNTDNNVLCDVSGYYAPQNGLPICWAAGIATTYNYKNGTKVSAKDVCNKVGHSYTGEIDTNVIDSAFHRYNLNYNYTPYSITFNSLKKHLKNAYLVPVGITFSNKSHVDVIIGVSVKNEKKWLSVYDPNINKSFVVEYQGSNTVFVSPETFAFSWIGTFRYYK